MNKKIKRIAVVMACAMVLSVSAAQSYAAAATTEPVVVVYSDDSGEPTRYDVIVWKYRVYNGQTQKRRWNETKAIWVDPFWINC